MCESQEVLSYISILRACAQLRALVLLPACACDYNRTVFRLVFLTLTTDASATLKASSQSLDSGVKQPTIQHTFTFDENLRDLEMVVRAQATEPRSTVPRLQRRLNLRLSAAQCLTALSSVYAVYAREKYWEKDIMFKGIFHVFQEIKRNFCRRQQVSRRNY